jgi:hypothetical protein
MKSPQAFTQQIPVAAFAAIVAILVLTVGTVPAIAIPITVDFSQHGEGPFDRNFFASSGIVFTQGDFVGFVQGDDALIGGTDFPIAGSFLTPVTSLAVSVAMGFQTVSDFTLTVYDASSAPIGATTFRLNQDTGDAGFMGFGYFTIDLLNIPQPAYSFQLTDQFVSSSFGFTSSEWGVSTLVFNQVTEPGTAALFALCLSAIALCRKARVVRGVNPVLKVAKGRNFRPEISSNAARANV